MIMDWRETSTGAKKKHARKKIEAMEEVEACGGGSFTRPGHR